MGLENHVRSYLREHFEVEGFPEVTKDKLIMVHVGKHGCKLQDIADALARDVFTKDAWFYVRDDELGLDTSTQRGTCPLFNEKIEIDCGEYGKITLTGHGKNWEMGGHVLSPPGERSFLFRHGTGAGIEALILSLAQTGQYDMSFPPLRDAIIKALSESQK